MTSEKNRVGLGYLNTYLYYVIFSQDGGPAAFRQQSQRQTMRIDDVDSDKRSVARVGVLHVAIA